MNSLTLCKNAGQFYLSFAKRLITISAKRFNNEEIIDPPDNLLLAVLNYEKRRNDPIDIKKARLLYQSRKRGMLENDILLSTFAAKYLANFTEEQTDQYDKLINLPSNDWDIFYWTMGMKPTPEQFDTEVMKLLKEHLNVVGLEARYAQDIPPLGPKKC